MGLSTVLVTLSLFSRWAEIQYELLYPYFQDGLKYSMSKESASLSLGNVDISQAVFKQKITSVQVGTFNVSNSS